MRLWFQNGRIRYQLWKRDFMRIFTTGFPATMTCCKKKAGASSTAIPKVTAFLIEQGRGRQVAVVGHFPFLPRLCDAAARLCVIENHPAEGEYPAAAASELIPGSEVVALTGSALINHTLDGLLALCSPGAVIVVLGPSTPLSPILFDHRVTVLSGTQVIDEEVALHTISQGGTFQQVRGTRLLTLTRELTSKASRI